MTRAGSSVPIVVNIATWESVTPRMPPVSSIPAPKASSSGDFQQPAYARLQLHPVAQSTTPLGCDQMALRRATIHTSLWLCHRCASCFDDTIASSSRPHDTHQAQTIQGHIRRVKIRVADLGGGNVVLLGQTLYAADPSPCSLCDDLVHARHTAALETSRTLTDLGP